MRVLVTGGAGYIGSVVTEELLKDANEVVVFDNLYKGHRGLVASTEKIRCELGWSPRFQNLRTIIEPAWSWMQAHTEGYVD